VKSVRSLALAAAPLALVLTACGTSEPAADASDSAEGASTSAASGPVSVTDSRGKTIELDEPAERVVALEWMQAESLVTLDVMPVAVADLDWYPAWVASAPLDDSVQDVGSRSEPSVQSILKATPDLVIADSTGPEAVVKQLEKRDIPVLVLTTADPADQIGTMRESFTTIAAAVGKVEQGEQVLADLDSSIEDAQEAIAASDAPKRFAFADGWVDGGNVSVRMFGTGSLMSDLAEQVGLEQAWTGEVDAEWGLGVTDPEGLTTLGDEVSFVYNQPEENSDVFADELTKNPIWNNLAFVQDGHVHKLDVGTWTFGGPLSARQYVDNLASLLG
jgi:ABC-type Fe3+-hydroxamate transport system substrate-binding protein